MNLAFLKVAASFLGGLLKGAMSLLAAFLAGKLSVEKKQAETNEKEARKDLDIAAGPLKRGSNLIDSL